MLPSDGSEGHRPSCDWISFKLTLPTSADPVACTLKLINHYTIGT